MVEKLVGKTDTGSQAEMPNFPFLTTNIVRCSLENCIVSNGF